MKRVLVLAALLALIAVGGFVIYRELSNRALENEITDLTETMEQEEDEADPSDLDETTDAGAVMTGDAEIDAELDDLSKELDSLDETEANGNPLSDL